MNSISKNIYLILCISYLLLSSSCTKSKFTTIQQRLDSGAEIDSNSDLSSTPSNVTEVDTISHDDESYNLVGLKVVDKQVQIESDEKTLPMITEIRKGSYAEKSQLAVGDLLCAISWPILPNTNDDIKEHNYITPNTETVEKITGLLEGGKKIDTVSFLVHEKTDSIYSETQVRKDMAINIQDNTGKGRCTISKEPNIYVFEDNSTNSSELVDCQETATKDLCEKLEPKKENSYDQYVQVFEAGLDCF